MKLNRIQAFVLTLGVALTSGAMFAGKADAQTATSTANFNGNVAPSAAINSGGFGAPVTYTPTVVPGASGGPTSLSATIVSGPIFDTNADRMDYNIGITTVRPVPANATNLLAQHNFILFIVGNGSMGPYNFQTTSGTGSGAPTTQTLTLVGGGFPSDVNGDNGLIITSRWSGGEDLFKGAYSAAVAVTVTAQ